MSETLVYFCNQNVLKQLINVNLTDQYKLRDASNIDAYVKHKIRGVVVDRVYQNDHVDVFIQFTNLQYATRFALKYGPCIVNSLME